MVYIQNIFKNYLRSKSKLRQNDFFISAYKIYTYVDKSVSTLGPHVWQILPSNTKSITSFSSLKTLLKMWFL